MRHPSGENRRPRRRANRIRADGVVEHRAAPRDRIHGRRPQPRIPAPAPGVVRLLVGEDHQKVRPLRLRRLHEWRRQHRSPRHATTFCAFASQRIRRPVLHRKVRQLHHQRRLEAQRHRRRRPLPRANALQEIAHMQFRREAKTARRFPFQQHFVLLAGGIHAARLPPNIHAGFVAVELVQLIVLRRIAHRGVVDGKHAQEVLRVLGSDHHAIGRVDARPMRLAAAAVTESG